jgi:perosamine synthetase
MIKFFFIIKIIIEKLIRLNLSFLRREISGYPEIVKKFEVEFAGYIGKKYGLSFCNGTSSIEAAIYALNLSNNDEILTTSSNFHASLGPIKNLGNKIVFVDIDDQTLTIDYEDLEKKINKKSKALLIVHPWGYPCNMDKIVQIVKKYNLKLIEDCSHSHGAIYNNTKIGSFADISCFSLQGNKAIQAGEGGITLTNDKNYYLRMSLYAHFNRHENEFAQLADYKKFAKTGLSKKLRAHPLGISIGYVDFKNLENLNKYKNEIYKKIDNIISNSKYSITTMQLNHMAIRGGFFGGYPIIIKNNDKIEKIKTIFKKYKIDIYPYHWLNHHQMEVFGDENLELPVTQEIKIKFYHIKIPYFLNFNFKKLKDCLSECEKI